MIGKLNKGHDTRGLLHYLLGPGRHNEHTNPHVVAGANLLGEVWGPRWPGEKLARADETVMADDLDRWFLEQRALDFDRSGVVVPRTKGTRPHVVHAILSVSAVEGALGSDRWAELAQDYITEMGWQDCQWMAIHHGQSENENDHLHIVLNRVDAEGRWASLHQDYKRSSEACRKLEQKHGLRRLSDGNERGLPGYSEAEGRRAEKEQTPGERYILEQLVRVAATESYTEVEFVEALRERGVRVRPRYATGGEQTVVGFSVSLGSQAGEKPVWFGGGRLAPDLTLPKLRERWVTADPEQVRAAWKSPRRNVDDTRRQRESVDARKAARSVEDVVAGWRGIDPLDEAAWRRVASDTAALSSALGQRFQRAEMVRTARALARSAQGPQREVHGTSTTRAMRLIMTASLDQDVLAWAAVVESLGRAVIAVSDAHRARRELVAAERMREVHGREIAPMVRSAYRQSVGYADTARAAAALDTLAPISGGRVGPTGTGGASPQPRPAGGTTKGSPERTHGHER